jgi:hypothetical protein
LAYVRSVSCADLLRKAMAECTETSIYDRTARQIPKDPTTKRSDAAQARPKERIRPERRGCAPLSLLLTGPA